VVWSPLGWGRLTGKIRRGHPLPKVSRLHNQKVVDIGPPVEDEYLYRVVDALDEVAKETGKTIPQIAINWLLERPSVATVIVGARNGGPPLILASGAGGELLASDVSAVLTYTRHVQILEDGEMAILSPGRNRVRTFGGRARLPRVVHVDWNAADAEKDGYPHFMLKEIHEQPRAIGMTISPLVDAAREDGLRRDTGLDAALLARARRVLLLGCGTS